MKRALIILVALMVTLAFSACSAPKEPLENAEQQEAKPQEPTSEGDQPAKIDEDSKDEPKEVIVGFANINEKGSFGKMVRNSMEKEAAARGWKIICLDNNSDGATAVKNADDLINMGVNYMIEFNVDQAVAPVIMEKFEAKNIPVVAIDIPHEGATFFGADNSKAGTVAGEAAGDYINTNWEGKVDYVVLIIQPVSGESVAPRVKNFPAGLKKQGDRSFR